MRTLFLLIFLLPAPARALEICDELWFTRNLAFDRAGYCFGSVLGQAVFDNAGCQQGSVALDRADTAMVAKVRKLEQEFECEVDTAQSFLAVPQLAVRKALVDSPFPTDTESACVGWQGERLPLLAARKGDAIVIGAVREGDTLLFQFEPVEGWIFVEVYQTDIPAGVGWVKVDITEANCAAIAG